MSNDLARIAPHLGTLIGPNHRTQALARKMQRRGEIQRVGQVKHLHNGNVIIRYIRLRSEGRVRRQLMIRSLALSTSGLLFLCSVGTMLYGARHVLMSLAGGAITLVSLRYLATRGRHQGACVGLHCSGCKH